MTSEDSSSEGDEAADTTRWVVSGSGWAGRSFAYTRSHEQVELLLSQDWHG